MKSEEFGDTQPQGKHRKIMGDVKDLIPSDEGIKKNPIIESGYKFPEDEKDAVEELKDLLRRAEINKQAFYSAIAELAGPINEGEKRNYLVKILDDVKFYGFVNVTDTISPQLALY